MHRIHPTSHPAAAWRPIHRFLATSLSLAVLAISSLCGTADAGPSYNFEEAGTGDVLATLELATLPATHLQVVGLDFSDLGVSIFGLPDPYPGLFDSSTAAFIMDGPAGLSGAGEFGIAVFTDAEAPESTFLPGVPVFFQLGADATVGRDFLFLERSVSDPGVESIFAVGDWVFVPEPSTLVLFVVGAVLVGSGARRCRTRDVR